MLFTIEATTVYEVDAPTAREAVEVYLDTARDQIHPAAITERTVFNHDGELVADDQLDALLEAAA